MCPGVGFDVVPTDCVAASLHAALPDATHLALGFDSRGTFSPGTAKTSMEGLAQGGRTRRDGVIEKVPLAFKTRTIDFGNGEKNAMTIPWGDVSTAWYSTGIPNIEVYVPASPRLVRRLRRLNWIRPILGLGFVQRGIKRLEIDRWYDGVVLRRDDVRRYIETRQNLIDDCIAAIASSGKQRRRTFGEKPVMRRMSVEPRV